MGFLSPMINKCYPWPLKPLYAQWNSSAMDCLLLGRSLISENLPAQEQGDPGQKQHPMPVEYRPVSQSSTITKDIGIRAYAYIKANQHNKNGIMPCRNQ